MRPSVIFRVLLRDARRCPARAPRRRLARARRAARPAVEAVRPPARRPARRADLRRRRPPPPARERTLDVGDHRLSRAGTFHVGDHRLAERTLHDLWIGRRQGGACASPISTEDCDSCPNGQLCGRCCSQESRWRDSRPTTRSSTRLAAARRLSLFAECNDPGDVSGNLNGPPSSSCGTCVSNLSGNTPCIVSWTNDCEKDQDCALFMACLYGCPSPESRRVLSSTRSA